MPGVPLESATPSLPFGCVASLKSSTAGSGAKAYASRYVTDGNYAYGQWRTGGFRGQSLWTKRGGAWCKTSTGIIVLDRAAIVRFGVPPANASRLLAKMRAVGELAPPAKHPTRGSVARHR